MGKIEIQKKEVIEMEKLNSWLAQHKVVSWAGVLIFIMVAFIVGMLSSGFIYRATVPENLIKSAIYAVLEDEMNTTNNNFVALRGRIEKIEQELEEKPDYAVDLISWHLNELDGAEDVAPMIETWRAQGWGIQLTALKRIATDEHAEGLLDAEMSRAHQRELYEEFVKIAKKIYN